MATIKKTTMPKKKMAEGGPTATTKTRKTLSGGTRTKTVSGNTVNITKTDKAGNIIKNKTRNRMQGWDESEAGGNSGMAKRGGSIKKKMAYGGVAKKPLRKAQPGTIIKEGPLTEKDTQMLNTNPMYKDTNSAYGYISSGMKPTPKGYRVTPQIKKDDKEKEIRSGANFKKGGMTKAKRFAALAPPYNKATAADRIAGAKKNKRK